MKPSADTATLHDGMAVITSPRAATSANSRWADYYELTKPRMNFLVVITTMVGYYVATRGQIHWPLLMCLLVGTALCAAAASALNQYIERDLDALMSRTRNRPLVTGRIAPAHSLVFALALAALGVVLLATTVNVLTAGLGLLTIAGYVFVYTPLKRHTTLNTVIGAVPGAIPPVMGFTAAQDSVTPAAIAVFAILFFWQMPHFLAIAILYRNDYRAAGFKMLPCVDGDLVTTSRMILLYSVALIPVTLVPTMIGAAGAIYFFCAILMGMAFLSFGVSCAVSRSREDARKLFFASIVYLPLLLAAMMYDKIN
jgi:protoheme IX farnesyltransferase